MTEVEKLMQEAPDNIKSLYKFWSGKKIAMDAGELILIVALAKEGVENTPHPGTLQHQIVTSLMKNVETGLVDVLQNDPDKSTVDVFVEASLKSRPH